MKTSIIAAMLFMVATPALAQDRAFEFKGVNTTTAYSGETRAMDKVCKVKGVGEERCGRIKIMDVGNTSVFDVETTFYNGHMVSVGASGLSRDFNDLDAAFTGKYGEAATVSVEKWQNQLGMAFDNVVKTWAFTDGTLTLKSIGRRRDEISFFFVANHDLPPVDTGPNNF